MAGARRVAHARVIATATWRALGTGVQVAVTDDARVEDAMAVVMEWLTQLDLAASRFRSDSEISRLNAAGGAPTQVSPLLARVIAVALDVAAITDGIVDPTVGSAMDTIGYDRDFDELMRGGARTALSDPVPAPGWRSVHLDRDRGVGMTPPSIGGFASVEDSATMEFDIHLQQASADRRPITPLSTCRAAPKDVAA